MSTTRTRVDQVADTLAQISDLCRVETVDVSARHGVLWVETNTTTLGSTTVVAVSVLAALVTTRTPADGAFLAAVLDLPAAAPLLDTLGSDADPQGIWWCGWLAGDSPHTPFSITIVCDARS
ncbi:hypothetical protein [Promicromonospora soli]